MSTTLLCAWTGTNTGDKVLHKPGLLTYSIQGDIPRPSRGTTIFIYEEGKVWLRETNSSLVWKKQLEGFREKRA